MLIFVRTQNCVFDQKYDCFSVQNTQKPLPYFSRINKSPAVYILPGIVVWICQTDFVQLVIRRPGTAQINPYRNILAGLSICSAPNQVSTSIIAAPKAPAKM